MTQITPTPSTPILFFLVFFGISLLPLLITSHNVQSGSCQRSCGDHHLRYPFGFSGAGCKIKLNCSSTGDITVDNFPVLDITPDAIKIKMDPRCGRPIKILQSLYGSNFAPTSRNAILLESCSSPAPCTIPTIMVQTHLETLNCSGSFKNSSKIGCYAENRTSGIGFLDYRNVSRRGCRYLLSSILAESFNNSGMSLDVQVAELGWWIDGDGCRCSSDAACTSVKTPEGRLGFRCECRDGFVGDGFLDGDGCRKARSNCNLAKYVSGTCGGTTRIAVLVGGAVAGASVMISMALICCLFSRKYGSRTRSISKYRFSEPADISIPIYPYKEIERATNGFSEKQRLGTGAYGTVYGGKLQNDMWVAIKRIKHNDSIDQFKNEIKLISSISHPNLVRLLGCSVEHGEQVLVYEFMPNGTLSQHLQRERSEGLAWPIRLAIAADTAQAVAYLHSANDPPIYHRDIKSSNILLDYNFGSKLADFGLSRLGIAEISHISTAPQGTPGYLDPQYHQNFHLSDKSDVYSFGVVMVEIITGLKAVDFCRPQNEVNLANLATDRISKGRLFDIIDPFLEAPCNSWTFSSVQKVAELAFRCLAYDRDMRPTMMEVAAELEQMRQGRLGPSDSEEIVPSQAMTPCSSNSSSIIEQPLSLRTNNDGVENEGGSVFETRPSRVSLMERSSSSKNDSPVSIEDPWLSVRSSPSSNCLLNNAVQ